MADVVALGELLIDFMTNEVDEEGYPTLKANAGGAPANFLSALAKYGISTALIGSVGDDAFGRMLIKTLNRQNIDTTAVKLVPEFFTTLAFVTLDESGNREFSFARKPGADLQLTLDDEAKKQIRLAKVFHFGTLSLTAEPARCATMHAVEYAKGHGALISCDPNLRKPLWKDEEEAKKWIDWALLQADIVKISDNEVDFLYGLNEVDGAKKLLEEYSAKLVFVTLGEKGCYAANKNGSVYVKGPEVNVKDTTAAGDIFGGAALSKVLNLKKMPDELDLDELKHIAGFACAAASLSTEHIGAICSIRDMDTVLGHIARN